MDGKTDEIKGRIKEAAGALTDDEPLRAEGKQEQAVVKVKQAIDKVVEKAQKAATTVAEKAHKLKEGL